jgi:predicted nucleotidyltransferase
VPNIDPNSVDDVDILGVFLSSKEYYIGLSQHKTKNPTTVEIMREVDGVLLDCVFYEIRHFVGMALKSNPNIFSALWVHPNHHILKNSYFEPYIANRRYFISRHHLYESFTGYANGQLKEMIAYNKQGYMGEKRRKLIEKFGYDVKNASHLIRLLHMGIEALQTGDIKVLRNVDAEMLIDIKTGKWTLDEVKMYADELFHQVKKAYRKSDLPEEPNKEKVESLLMHVIKAYINSEKDSMFSFFI